MGRRLADARGEREVGDADQAAVAAPGAGVAVLAVDGDVEDASAVAADQVGEAHGRLADCIDLRGDGQRRGQRLLGQFGRIVGIPAPGVPGVAVPFIAVVFAGHELDDVLRQHASSGDVEVRGVDPFDGDDDAAFGLEIAAGDGERDVGFAAREGEGAHGGRLHRETVGGGQVLAEGQLVEPSDLEIAHDLHFAGVVPGVGRGERQLDARFAGDELVEAGEIGHLGEVHDHVWIAEGAALGFEPGEAEGVGDGDGELVGRGGVGDVLDARLDARRDSDGHDVRRDGGGRGDGEAAPGLVSGACPGDLLVAGEEAERLRRERVRVLRVVERKRERDDAVRREVVLDDAGRGDCERIFDLRAGGGAGGGRFDGVRHAGCGLAREEPPAGDVEAGRGQGGGGEKEMFEFHGGPS